MYTALYTETGGGLDKALRFVLRRARWLRAGRSFASWPCAATVSDGPAAWLRLELPAAGGSNGSSS
jgi:hypothetical protein